jgi:hypothetical protein
VRGRVGKDEGLVALGALELDAATRQGGEVEFDVATEDGGVPAAEEGRLGGEAARRCLAILPAGRRVSFV